VDTQYQAICLSSVSTSEFMVQKCNAQVFGNHMQEITQATENGE